MISRPFHLRFAAKEFLEEFIEHIDEEISSQELNAMVDQFLDAMDQKLGIVTARDKVMVGAIQRIPARF